MNSVSSKSSAIFTIKPPSYTRNENAVTDDILLNNLFQISEILDRLAENGSNHATSLLKRATEIRCTKPDGLPVPLFIAISKVALSLEALLRRCSPREPANERHDIAKLDGIDMDALEKENMAFLLEHKKKYESLSK